MSADACKSAAAIEGKKYRGPAMIPEWPSGCVLDPFAGAGVYFNPHPTGANYSGFQPLCASAPLPTADALAPALVRGLRLRCRCTHTQPEAPHTSMRAHAHTMCACVL